MPYTPSPFLPGDLVETTEEFREFKENYSKKKGWNVITYMKGRIKKVYTFYHSETGIPILDYIMLENGFSARPEHFKKVE